MAAEKSPFAFDPDQFREMFNLPDFQNMQKLFTSARLPAADMEAILTAQKKNFAAVVEMNKLAMIGYQEFFRRQAAQIESAVAEARELISAAQGQPLTLEQAQRNFETARAAVDKALANARELAELAEKTNTGAFDILSARFDEAMRELTASTGKSGT